MNTSVSFATFFLGMAASAGLIIAIGAQNAFVMRQGIRREQVGAVVTVSALSDILLISIGTAGIGSVSQSFPWAVSLLTAVGIVFLLTYGWKAAKRAWRPLDAGLAADAALHTPMSLRTAVLQAAAFSWLNPHAWLDTTVLLGSLANAHGEQRWVFASGAACASVVWFVLLAWLAARLAPLFRQPRTWRVFDASVAVMMLTLAGNLTLHSFKGA